jgi:hypothetical protein
LDICRILETFIKFCGCLSLSSVDLRRKWKISDNLGSFKIPFESSVKFIDFHLERFLHIIRSFPAILRLSHK